MSRKHSTPRAPNTTKNTNKRRGPFALHYEHGGARKLTVCVTTVLILTERGENALRRMAIPQWNVNRSPCPFIQRAESCGNDPRGVAADYYVCSHRYGNWSLGIFAQGEAGNTQNACLFLDASGIRQH